MINGIIKAVIGLAVGLSLFAVITGRTYLFKAVAYNFADVDDYKIFDNNDVAAGSVQPWPVSPSYNKQRLPASLDSELTVLKNIAVVVIKNDSLVFEQYESGYSDSSYSGSFSVAKSITSILIGVALREGKITTLNDPVGKYLPEFSTGEKTKVTILHLLTMSSGSDWDESYSNPLSTTTEIYYGSNAYKTATGVEIIRTPGTYHDYKSGDTQLLGLILEKATGMSLSEYASQKIWKPVGAEHTAKWSTDKEGGKIKAYCCFNSNAKDFARIGQLMLDSGKWKGATIIDPDYASASVRPNTIVTDNGQPCDFYGYQWWLVPYKPGVFYARGILGQYIIVIPKSKTVIVRLGEKRGPIFQQTVPKEVNDLIEWADGLR
ncbi:MAG: serine hydrolase [Chitinophagaceae bacterium]|nr:serine hydrolase [Chitinophagaceae bacterium]